MKALIAIDSFKGCLTSMEAGKAALEAFTEGEAEIIPVSDGGEGFSTILTESLGGTFRTAVCHDPIGRPIKARYGLRNPIAGYVLRHGRQHSHHRNRGCQWIGALA